jgi:hypothetical protein
MVLDAAHVQTALLANRADLLSTTVANAETSWSQSSVVVGRLSMLALARKCLPDVPAGLTHPTAHHVRTAVQFRQERNSSTRRSALLHDRNEGLWRNKTIAEFNDVLDFVPLYCTRIKPHAKPSSRPDVSRKIVALRLRTRAIDVFSQCGLHAYGDDTVSMVIVQEVGEDLLSDTEVGVVAAKGSNGLWKGEADLRQVRESGIFAELGGHDLVPLRLTIAVTTGIWRIRPAAA